MKKRVLGKTGEGLSMVGFGGILVMDEESGTAARLVAQAVERGINYFDVAPSYGNAEERLGPALKPYRNDVFLACKTMERSKEGAAHELQESLKKLETDHFDLYQFHAVGKMEEVDQILGPGGALETVLEAQKAGVIRYIGFSAHSEEAAIALLDRFPFDSVLYPVNWVCWNKGGFGQRTMEKATSLGTGILALKTLAKRRWNEGEERIWSKTWYRPVDTQEEADLAVRFTMSQPVTAGPCPGHEPFLWMFCDAVDCFTPLTKTEAEMVAAQSADLIPPFPLH